MQTKNLFPPLVDTYTAGFLLKDGQGTCNVKFSLSSYTDAKEVKSIWVNVVNPKTNKSVVAESVSPTGLISFNISNLAEEGTLPIGGSKIAGGWQSGQTYKIQLRFCALDASQISGQSDMIAKSEYFSEWSTPTLVTPTKTFSFTFSSPVVSGDIGTIDPYINLLSGTVTYGDSSEYLDQYRITISGEGAQLYDSGICYTDSINPNTLQHRVNIGFKEGVTYNFTYDFISSNLYSHRLVQPVKVQAKTYPTSLPLTIKAEEDAEYGRIKLIISPITETSSYNSNILIKRASHETNFNYWEDVNTLQVTLDSDKSSYITYDYTVDSGNWYHYAIFKVNENNEIISPAVQTNEPTMVILNDMFLNGGGRQLRLRFDPNITSYQHVLSESSTQTIGGKYPFIKRNGNLNYKQIGISGLISYHMDKGDDIFHTRQNEQLIWTTNGSDLFTSKAELYNNSTLYDSLNTNSRATDIVLERKFREKVMEFLLDGKVKLFRSPTEAPTLIRLMNVSFNPKQELGRMVYSFSATGHEIADCTLENISKYQIQENVGYQDIVQSDLFEITNSTGFFMLTGPIDYIGQPGVQIENLLDKLTPSDLKENESFKLAYANNLTFEFDDGYTGYPVLYEDGFYQIDYNASTQAEHKLIFYYKIPNNPNLMSTTRDPLRWLPLDDLGDITFLAMAIAAVDGNVQTSLRVNLSGNIVGSKIYKED